MDVVNDTLIMLSHEIPGLIVAGTAMISMLFGLIRKESGLMIFAAFLTIPFAYAMGAWSGFGLFVRLLPLFSLGSAFAIDKDDFIFAWALPMPAFGYFIYILFKIISANLG